MRTAGSASEYGVSRHCFGNFKELVGILKRQKVAFIQDMVVTPTLDKMNQTSNCLNVTWSPSNGKDYTVVKAVPIKPVLEAEE